MCTPHLAKTEVDGVEKRSASFWTGCQHAILQIFDAVGEGAGQFGAFIEADQEKFVGGIGGLEKLNGGIAGFCDFVGHAAADIKDHTDGDGHIFGRKRDDFLFGVVFKDPEVVGLETGDQSIVRIGDGDVDQRDIYVGVQHFAGLDG